MSRLVAGAVAAFVLGVAVAKELPVLPQAPVLPKPLLADDPKKAAIVLLDDQADPLIPFLTNDGFVGADTAVAEEVDVYSGATALRVTPQQRFRAQLPGWSYPIREKPAEGEFRYLRFAWKKAGGGGIMVQLHDAAKTWCVRYHAGPNSVGWGSQAVADVAPAEWTVVTRDLFKDFGDLTLTGMAFTPMDANHGLFDHVLLGRTMADLDAKSDELLGTAKPKEKLGGKARDDAWAALGSRDADKAGAAIRAFLQAAPDQVTFVRDRLTGHGASAEQRKALRKRIGELVAKLGDEDFDTRMTAEAELEKLGDAARAEVVEAAKSPTPEVAFRATALAARLRFGELPPAAIRAARTARVLARAATADAKKLLGEMAAGDFGPDHAGAAKATQARMGK